MEKVLLKIVCLVKLAVVYLSIIPPVRTFSKILHVLISTHNDRIREWFGGDLKHHLVPTPIIRFNCSLHPFSFYRRVG